MCGGGGKEAQLKSVKKGAFLDGTTYVTILITYVYTLVANLGPSCELFKAVIKQ